MLDQSEIYVEHHWQGFFLCIDQPALVHSVNLFLLNLQKKKVLIHLKMNVAFHTTISEQRRLLPLSWFSMLMFIVINIYDRFTCLLTTSTVFLPLYSIERERERVREEEGKIVWKAGERERNGWREGQRSEWETRR